jgi:hypothetical protein
MLDNAAGDGDWIFPGQHGDCGDEGDEFTFADLKPPETVEELRRFVLEHFCLRLPARSVCPHHDTPMDYLAASFFDHDDLVVWANRGGGKTLVAAVAAVMDAAFHEATSIRVLGGSFDQSDRLADYIREILDMHSGLVAGKPTRQGVRLVNGSDIHMLAQSQRAVRGQHVQKICCDEVELFDDDVWRAVQFATNSAGSGPTRRKGSIEVLSTLHRPGGLMQKLVDKALADRALPPARRQGGYRLIRWCVWDVIERCGPERTCGECPLADDCRGVARQADGFFAIDDAIAIKARSSRAAWEAEMLCTGARAELVVFGEFDRARHVRTLEYRPEWPTYRAMDFGYANPLVCLWLQVSPAGVVHVLREYVRTHLPIATHAVEILRRDPGPAAATYVDPAGGAKEATSGAACTELLAAAGIPCTARRSTIAEGLELIRFALAPAAGPPRLAIDPACVELVSAFETYHYEEASRSGPDGQAASDQPVKDGPDHAIDALRYFFVNRMRPRMDTSRSRY